MTPILMGLGSTAVSYTSISARVNSQNDGVTYMPSASYRGGAGEDIWWKDKAGRALNTNLRFTGLQIPRGATIDDARITVWSLGTRTGVNANDYVNVYAEQVNNATAITSAAALTSRWSNVGTSVTWPVGGNLVLNGPITSPNISAVVQQIVNRAGWPDGTGGAIQFFIDGSTVANSGLSDDINMQSYDLNNSAQYIPLLEITYIS